MGRASGISRIIGRGEFRESLKCCLTLWMPVNALPARPPASKAAPSAGFSIAAKGAMAAPASNALPPNLATWFSLLPPKRCMFTFFNPNFISLLQYFCEGDFITLQKYFSFLSFVNPPRVNLRQRALAPERSSLKEHVPQSFCIRRPMFGRNPSF